VLAIVQYASHDPEVFLFQNVGNGSPVAASDDTFAILEAASFASWPDVTQVVTDLQSEWK